MDNAQSEGPGKRKAKRASTTGGKRICILQRHSDTVGKAETTSATGRNTTHGREHHGHPLDKPKANRKKSGMLGKKYRPKYPPKEWGMRYILNMTPPEQTKARNVIIIGDESWVDETNPYASEWKKQVPWTVWPISVRKGSIKKHARKIARQQFMNILKPGDMVFITLGRRDLWAKRKRERRQKAFAAS